MEITLTEFEDALDKRFSKMASKEDLKAFVTKTDLKEALAPYATKDDLVTLEKNLKDYAEDQTETLAAYIAETIAIPLQEHMESCQKMRI